MTDKSRDPLAEGGAMLKAAFAQLQHEYRIENRHADAHMILTVAAKLTDESAERVLWIMLDIMAGRRDARGKRTAIAAPEQSSPEKSIPAITHQGTETAQ